MADKSKQKKKVVVPRHGGLYVMGEIGTSNIDSLLGIFDTISSLMPNVSLRFEKDHIRIMDVDDGKILMVYTKLRPYHTEFPAGALPENEPDYESTPPLPDDATSRKRRRGSNKQQREIFRTDDVSDTSEPAGKQIESKTDFYHCYTETIATVDTVRLCRHLSTGKQASSIVIKALSSDRHGTIEKLYIGCSTPNERTDCYMPVYVTEQEDLDMKQQEMQYVVSMPSKALSDNIKRVITSAEGNVVKLSVVAGPDGTAEFHIRVDGDAGQTETTIAPDTKRRISISNGDYDGQPLKEITRMFEGSYAAKPIQCLGKMAGAARFVKIHLSDPTQHPLCLSFEVPDLGDVLFFIAPRIEEDE